MPAQADALARMTFELKIRSVGAQAERVEKDLRALVNCTSQDKEFRQEHERRLQEVWREVLAVKARVAEVEDGQDEVKVNIESCQMETQKTIEQFRGEMGEIRELVEALQIWILLMRATLQWMIQMHQIQMHHQMR